jgi:hypothetical protein
VRQSRRFHTHGEPADGKDVDVQEVNRIFFDKIGELKKVFPLARGNRNAGLLAQLSQQARIVVHDRLFEPH